MPVVVRLFLHLVVLVVALTLLTWVFEPELVDRMLATIDLPPDGLWFRLTAAGVAGSSLLGQAYLVLRLVRGIRYRRELSYVNEFGKVSISLVAIEDALTRAIDQESGVRKVQCRVYEDRIKRCVIVDCALTLWEQGSVKGLNERCQDILRRRFAQLLPDRENVEIHLTVHRLTHSRSTYVSEGEDEAPGEPGSPLTPGLVMTAGETGPEAGEALLANSRRANVTDVPQAVGRRGERTTFVGGERAAAAREARYAATRDPAAAGGETEERRATKRDVAAGERPAGDAAPGDAGTAEDAVASDADDDRDGR